MSQKKISFTLKELSKIIDAKIAGDENIIISNIATIQGANKESITFLANKKYSKFLSSTSASALIVHTEDKIDSDITLLKCSKDKVMPLLFPTTCPSNDVPVP